jgi:hypothetical protein
VPLLIVHGDKDRYFPPEHARQLYMAAREPKELWLLPGMGHAESACSQDLVDRVGRWIDQATLARRAASARAAEPGAAEIARAEAIPEATTPDAAA